jgi:ABC-type glycerol-3-phosphate transport system substrate-binding protein
MRRPALPTLALLALLLPPLLSGCRPQEPPDAPRTLTVACCDQTSFDHQYRDYFEAKFPNWRIALVPTYTDEVRSGKIGLADYLRQKKPDLAILTSSDYLQLADAGLLRDLGGWMRRDGPAPDDLVPGVADFLLSNADGKWYGLSPTFAAQALFYNKNLFRLYGVGLPQGPMTWRETMRLAGRFAQQDRTEPDVYGFQMNWVSSPYDLIQQIGQTEGVRAFNAQTGAITADTDAWKSIFRDAVQAFRDGALSTVEVEGTKTDQGVMYFPEDMERMELFKQGKAALSAAQDDLYRKLKASPPAFEWGVMPGPVNARDPERGGWLLPNFVFAVPRDSSQPEAAWEVIRYFHSEEMGQIQAALGEGLFSLRDYPQRSGDPDLEAFYRLRPAETVPFNWADTWKIPIGFQDSFRKLVNDEAGRVLQGTETADEAVRRIQSEGEALMRQAKEKAKAEAAPGGG